MTSVQASRSPAPRFVSEPRRWLLASLGVVSVGVAAVGVVTPGLPTTIFLIGAAWCFGRSCPWMERRLIRNRFFAPFLVHLEPGSRMPRRAQLVTVCVMWTAIGVSGVLLLTREAWAWYLGGLALAGVAGTVAIVRQGEPWRRRSAAPTA